MREQDAVFLIYLPLTFLLYAMFSGRYLSILAGREPPRLVRASIEQLYIGRPQPSVRKALAAYIGWTAMSELAPVLMALSDAPGFIRIASIVEVATAVAWTVYMRTRPAS
jgi:hypothetical protein